MAYRADWMPHKGFTEVTTLTGVGTVWHSDLAVDRSVEQVDLFDGAGRQPGRNNKSLHLVVRANGAEIWTRSGAQFAIEHILTRPSKDDPPEETADEPEADDD